MHWNPVQDLTLQIDPALVSGENYSIAHADHLALFQDLLYPVAGSGVQYSYLVHSLELLCRSLLSRKWSE